MLPLVESGPHSHPWCLFVVPYHHGIQIGHQLDWDKMHASIDTDDKDHTCGVYSCFCSMMEKSAVHALDVLITTIKMIRWIQ